MAMRITTGMAMNTYRYNLQNSTANLTDARNKVLTQRQFDTFAENPTAATQAWRVRQAMRDNANYQENNSDTYSRFNIAWATMGMVKTNLESTADDADIRARTDSTAAARRELGKILSDTADSVIQAMNSAKFGEHFVFSGDDEMNAPFSWDGETLLYRGVNVNAGKFKDPSTTEGIPAWAKDESGNVTGLRELADLPAGMPASSTDSDEQKWIDYYNASKAFLESGSNGTAPTQPTGVPAPDWAKDENGDPIELEPENKPPEGMPTSSDDVYDQAWMDYFNKLKTAVDAGDDPSTVTKPSDPPAWTNQDEYGVPEKAKNVKDTDPAYDRMWAAYYKDNADVQRLEALSAEYENIDLGMGLQEDENGNLIDGTAFDRSLPGINMLGYGIDADGDPVNIVMIMKRLGEIYGGCDAETGRFSNDDAEEAALTEEADRLMKKFQLATDRTNSTYADITTKGHYLQENQARLKLQGDYLQEERANIENVDLADAITEFSWDYYCYSAALKVGTQLLSQSLIDYMS